MSGNDTTVIDSPDPQRGRKARWGPLPLFAGVALVLAGAGMFVVAGSYDTPQTAKMLGKPANAPVNQGATNPADITAHNSPSLVRNPRDEGNLAVADRIDTPRFSCAFHVSADGGSTWQQKTVPAPKGERLCYAPDVAFGADGKLYLSFVTLRGRANAPNAAWLVTSTDKGSTFSKPIKVLRQKLPFQVRLAADPKKPNRLYVTWLQASEVGLFRFPEPGNPINAMRSDDGGETWEWAGSLYYQPHSIRHIPGYFCGCPDLAVAADGTLVAILHSYEDDDGEMCLQVLRLREVS